MNFQRPNQKDTFDWLQLAAIAGLMLVSVAFVYSATLANSANGDLPWYNQTWVRQIIWFGLGLGIAAALCVVDYHSLSRWANVVYWLMILCLIAVLIPHIGTVRFGARRWIELKVFQFQPSEFAKLAFIMAGASFLSRPPEELAQPKNFWKAIGLMMLPFVLVLKEPDLGSALVLLPTGLVMMIVAGTPRRYLVRLLASVGLLGTLFTADLLFAPPSWQVVHLEDYQRNRLLNFFGRSYTDFAPPTATSAELQRLRQQQLNDAYNVRQALISVGSGGPFGTGWQRGPQNVLEYLPRAVAHNDFIFSVIAEEKGFVGSVTVLTLYAVVLFTGLRTAGQARDRLGRLLAVGIVALIFSHVFVNIGMNIRIMPVTGVPLPLLSYGGSSVLCSLLAVGLMQNIHIHRKGY
jgi:rod shape determining protein RodA